SPTVIVFSIDAVGTLTAWTTNVMPNKAMITVTTADSKYSRITVFGGPEASVSFSSFTSRSRPFGFTERAANTSGLSAIFFSVVTGSFITAIVEVAQLPVKRAIP